MSSFRGFPREIVQFFNNLTLNNNKTWFDAHKQEYEQLVKRPAEEFVVALGSRLRTIAPEIRAIPKEFFAPDLVDYVFERFRRMLPLHEWLTSTFIPG